MRGIVRGGSAAACSCIRDSGNRLRVRKLGSAIAAVRVPGNSAEFSGSLRPPPRRRGRRRRPHATARRTRSRIGSAARRGRRASRRRRRGRNGARGVAGASVVPADWPPRACASSPGPRGSGGEGPALRTPGQPAPGEPHPQPRRHRVPARRRLHHAPFFPQPAYQRLRQDHHPVATTIVRVHQRSLAGGWVTRCPTVSPILGTSRAGTASAPRPACRRNL